MSEQPSSRDGQDTTGRPEDADRSHASGRTDDTRDGAPDPAVCAAARPERRWRRRRLVLGAALAAALAVVAGATAAVVSSGPAGRPSAGGSPGGTTGGGTARGGAAGPGSASPGNGRHGAAPAGRSTRIFLTGRVSALTAASVTIASGGPPVRAAVTPSTLFTGRVSGLAGVRVGDQVAATITVRTGRATATRLRDPAAQPSGGNIP